jgi:hypothetical protein
MSRARALVLLALAGGCLLLGGCGSGTPRAVTARASVVRSGGQVSTSASVVSSLAPAPHAKPVSLPATVVAAVAGTPITSAQFEAAYRARVAVGWLPGAVAPDPPSYVRCIAAQAAVNQQQRKRLAQLIAASPKAVNGRAPRLGGPLSEAQLRRLCEQRRVAAIGSVLSGLISERWTLARAAAAHVTVSEAQVQGELRRERAVFRTRGAWRAFVSRSGGEAGLGAMIRMQLLARVLAVRTGAGGARGARARLRAQQRLRSRTLCRAGYVVALCANASGAVSGG